MLTATNDEDLISISSEAFELLVLENHWDRWMEVYENVVEELVLEEVLNTRDCISKHSQNTQEEG